MMIFSLVAMTGLEKCCITSAYLQWLCHSGEWPVGLLFSVSITQFFFFGIIFRYPKRKKRGGGGGGGGQESRPLRIVKLAASTESTINI